MDRNCTELNAVLNVNKISPIFLSLINNYFGLFKGRKRLCHAVRAFTLAVYVFKWSIYTVQCFCIRI